MSRGALERGAGAVERALEEIGALSLREVEPALAGPMRYALGTRGKRFRPLLCFAAYRAIHGEGEPLPRAMVRLACGVELVHTYSLVHDDLPCMDDDAVRRGRETVHRVHGTALATLGGAALLPAAMGIVADAAGELGLTAAEGGRLVVELCTAAGAEGMVGGQLLDLEAEGRAIGAAELEAIHRAKTGALLTAALRMGAIAARAKDGPLRGLTEYGRGLGLAFQIIDDILDVTADSGVLGKTAGKDCSAGKSTYPALFGVEGARRLAAERVEEAVAALKREDVPSEELEALARYVVERER